ncbi:MAG: sugar phosphate isomerase/epimerase, partial [Verrucomicrobiae bacterium]|nr:sugar phosphate isomerase/epimerase [Verrucomicrobiae bacterium]
MKILPFASVILCLSSISAVRAAEPIPDDHKVNGFAIGCQAYTFNRFTTFEAIEKTAAAGGKVIEFYPGQRLSPQEPDTKWDHNASPETIAKVKAKLKEHGLIAVAYGVVGLSKDEAECR